MANPFAAATLAASGAAGSKNPFLQHLPKVGSADSADSSNESSSSHDALFARLRIPLPTRSRAVPIRSIVKRSMTAKRINNPNSQVGMQCMLGEDSKHYYIPLDSYDPSHLEIIDELSPLLVNPMPDQFQKGALYTYIIASILTKDQGTGKDIELVQPTLYVCKAHSTFEFGTKHHHIFFRMALTNKLANIAQENGIDANKVEFGLYASGEIKCIKPRKLVFNFFSGTYKMKRVIPANRAQGEILFMKRVMLAIDPNYKIRFESTPFITSESLPITATQLSFLESKGIPVFPFDTRDQCKQMQYHYLRIKNTEKRPITLEEMKQKYEDLRNPPPAPAPTNAHIMGTVELTAYANQHKVPIPEPYDKGVLRTRVQSHMDTNKSKAGGKKRTMKKRK